MKRLYSNIQGKMLSDAVEKIRKTQPLDRITPYTKDGVRQTSGLIANDLEFIINRLGDKKVGELVNNPPLLSYINTIFTYY